MRQEDNKIIATCPNCTTVLLKARSANGVEVRCRKCKRKYDIDASYGTMQLREISDLVYKPMSA